MKPIRPPGSSYPNIFIAIRLTIPIYKYRLRWSPFLAFRTKNGPPQSRERNSPIRPGGQGGTLTPSAQSGLFTVRSIRGRRRRSRPSRALRARHLPRGPGIHARPKGFRVYVGVLPPLLTFYPYHNDRITPHQLPSNSNFYTTYIETSTHNPLPLPLQPSRAGPAKRGSAPPLTITHFTPSTS